MTAAELLAFANEMHRQLKAGTANNREVLAVINIINTLIMLEDMNSNG